MALSVWITFFVASWAISISPGAGAIAAMSSGLNHGFRRGYFTTVGLIAGIWTQVLVVSLGLGALIAASSFAFSLIKWLGVAYLIWLGIKQLRAPVTPLVMNSASQLGTRRRDLVLRGWMVNAVNPKGTVFLLAVVPQFLDLAHPLATQYAVIGATLAFTDLVVMGMYTAMAAKVLRLLKTARQMRLLNRTFGGLFIGMGLVLATFKRAAQ